MAKVVYPPEVSKYKFVSCSRNPDFSPGVLVPLRTCLEYNKSCKPDSHNINDGHVIYDRVYGVLETSPKWITTLMRSDGFTYYTNNLKSGNQRRNKAVYRFMDYYEPLYRSREVSILMFTFTRANYARLDIAGALNCVKSRLKSLKWHFRAYIWVKELWNKDGSLHLHYHLIVVVDRIRIEKIPWQLKMSELWGQSVRVEFIRKTVRGYLSKYLTKGQGKINGYRSYAISRTLQ